MAGVIGQLTANARKRRRENVIDSSKCVYVLPYFHPHGFAPKSDNQFAIRRARYEFTVQIQRNIDMYETNFIEKWHFEKQVFLHVQLMIKRFCFQKKKKSKINNSLKRMIIEALLVIVVILFLPTTFFIWFSFMHSIHVKMLLTQLIIYII